MGGVRSSAADARRLPGPVALPVEGDRPWSRPPPPLLALTTLPCRYLDASCPPTTVASPAMSASTTLDVDRLRPVCASFTSWRSPDAYASSFSSSSRRWLAPFSSGRSVAVACVGRSLEPPPSRRDGPSKSGGGNRGSGGDTRMGEKPESGFLSSSTTTWLVARLFLRLLSGDDCKVLAMPIDPDRAVSRAGGGGDAALRRRSALLPRTVLRRPPLRLSARRRRRPSRDEE
mmetsp:Transcript_12982/g.40315  ORF Transcript_12982/g.40315 Transcript_12982/m.40315 type:complete len:231 (+) Transcript_12982:211-903(+)